MCYLPEEIIEENILTRLPVKSISRFRCVSKKWQFLFQNPNFIQKHLNHAILMNKFNILVTNDDDSDSDSDSNDDNDNDNDDDDDDDDDTTEARPHLYFIDNNLLSSLSSPSCLGHALDKIEYPFMSEVSTPEIWGSCNGLLMIETSDDDYCIWNPATREYKHLPSADSSGLFFIYHGFGFDSKNGDYKLLQIGSYHDLDTQARIYSLASNSWKNLGVIPYDFSYTEYKGLFHNGVLYWMVGLESPVIVCFDLSEETFRELPLPKNNSKGTLLFSDSELGIWQGKLCLLGVYHTKNPVTRTHKNDHIDVFTLIDNKWSKHFKITAQIADISYRRPIQILQNGDILLEGGPSGKEGFGLMSYDPNFDRASALKILDMPDMPEVETYVETLVPLNSGTYVGRFRGKDSTSSRGVGLKDEIELEA